MDGARRRLFRSAWRPVLILSKRERKAGTMRDESERPGEQRSLDGRWPFKKMNREELFKVITWFLGSQTEKYAVEGQSEAQEETLPTKSKVNRRFFETLYLNELARRHFQADPTEETQNLLLRLARHVAFSPLKRRARAAAIVHTFLAVTAHRQRDSLPYWLLESVSHEHRGPIVLKKGAFPAWRRSARTTERLARETEKLFFQIEQIERGFVSCHDTPAVFVNRAVKNLYEALAWMQAFPAVSDLKRNLSRYRQPDTPKESPGALAYVLDNLFRNHYDERLKVAEIQCRIALIENQFLGQNVASFEGFGSPAVQRQILRFKKSHHCKALERDLERELASEHRMRLEECLPLTRSEGVRMVSEWCASDELHIADARKSVGRGTWLKETESEMWDYFFERYKRRAADSSVIEALDGFRDEVTARLANQVGARSELEHRISVLCSNVEQHILRIRASPFLGPVPRKVIAGTSPTISANPCMTRMPPWTSYYRLKGNF